VLLLALASPAARADRAWEQFRGRGDPVGGSRFGTLRSGRYDMWRVGLHQFERHPLQGIGADNFAVPYLQERTGGEQPAYPHSLLVKMLSQLGVVGSLLLAAFLVSAFRWTLGPDTPARGVAAAAALPFAAWFLHATVDWLWEIPACGLTAFALLGVAAGLRNDRRDRRLPERPRLRTLSLVTAVCAVVTVASSLAFPWLAARYEVRAADAWLSAPELAHAELDRAARLNPLSDRPYVLSGAMASRRGDYRLMRASFERALERNPQNWYSHLELAVALSQAGETKAAARHAEEALALNPRESIVRLVQAVLAAGSSIDPALIDALLLRQLGDI
jgi:O-Antigen ligase/Tetratricopeptide repeat